MCESTLYEENDEKHFSRLPFYIFLPTSFIEDVKACANKRYVNIEIFL